MEVKLIDHLFRHHSGKMVSVLTRIFGLSNLEIIEDAVQDTFLKASINWRKQQPENPEAWLTKAAKNRVIDIFRQRKAEEKHFPELKNVIKENSINELFLDTEIEDAQLRMIFTACHPKLDPKDQISFALKTISGFNTKEIASALLTKEETIKIINLAGNSMEEKSTGNDLTRNIFEKMMVLPKSPSQIALDYVKQEVKELI